jgi:uncharacterized protein (TIGR00290 family)
MPERILLGWSGGKDSCMTLAQLLNDDRYEVAALVTTVTEGFDRISMHGVRRDLLEAQASALGIPLEIVYIPMDANHTAYQSRMEAVFARYRQQAISTVAFGDLFLVGVRRYREEWLARLRMQAIFPIWHQDTARLALAFIGQGFKAVITCVDTTVLAPSFAGRTFDHQFLFLRDLPTTVDPCGENGEFHSFVFDGPIFQRPVSFAKGRVVQRDSHSFCDLIPAYQEARI